MSESLEDTVKRLERENRALKKPQLGPFVKLNFPKATGGMKFYVDKVGHFWVDECEEVLRVRRMLEECYAISNPVEPS